MTWLDMLTMTVAALSALECVTGRLAAMNWREHKHSLTVGYLLAAGVCILAASLIWQGQDSGWLDLAAWGIAAHLGLSWRAWRAGPPAAALRDDTQGMVPVTADSRQDDGRR